MGSRQDSRVGRSLHSTVPGPAPEECSTFFFCGTMTHSLLLPSLCGDHTRTANYTTCATALSVGFRRAQHLHGERSNCTESPAAARLARRNTVVAPSPWTFLENGPRQRSSGWLRSCLNGDQLRWLRTGQGGGFGKKKDAFGDEKLARYIAQLFFRRWKEEGKK